MKYNFVVILKDDQSKVEGLRELSEFEPDMIISDKGWIAIMGAFEEESLHDLEYYSLAIDWQTLSGWKDRPL